MSLYFKRVDTILKIRRNPLRKEIGNAWFKFMAIAMALNLMFLLGIIQRNIFNFLYDLEIKFVYC
jgi:hypothetical protein